MKLTNKEKIIQVLSTGSDFTVSKISKLSGIDIKNIGRYIKQLENEEYIRIRVIQKGKIREKHVTINKINKKDENDDEGREEDLLITTRNSSFFTPNQYKNKILDCIKRQATGITIQDIIDDINVSRNTISKYILSLELEKKVIKKRVGVYNLYFSADKTYISQEIIRDFYRAMMFSLKKNISKNEKILKSIGSDIGNFLEIKLKHIPNIEEDLIAKGENPIKLILELFDFVYPYLDLVHSAIDVKTINMNEQENRAVYRFKNSDILETEDDYIYHFQIVCGIIESTLKRELNKEVNSRLENIHISENRVESYADISITIS